MSEQTPGRADAIGQLEDEIAEQARTIADYRETLSAMQRERDDLRALVAEILGVIEAVAEGVRPITAADLAAWHRRAERRAS